MWGKSAAGHVIQAADQPRSFSDDGELHDWRTSTAAWPTVRRNSSDLRAKRLPSLDSLTYLRPSKYASSRGDPPKELAPRATAAALWLAAKIF